MYVLLVCIFLVDTYIYIYTHVCRPIYTCTLASKAQRSEKTPRDLDVRRGLAWAPSCWRTAYGSELPRYTPNGNFWGSKPREAGHIHLLQTHICTSICIYVHIHTCIYVPLHKSKCTYTYTCTQYICIYIYIHIRICIYSKDPMWVCFLCACSMDLPVNRCRGELKKSPPAPLAATYSRLQKAGTWM